MLSTPTPARPTTLSRAPRKRTSLVTLVRLRTTSAWYSGIAARSPFPSKSRMLTSFPFRRISTAVRSRPSVIRIFIASRRMRPRNKKTSEEKERDRQDEEGEEEDDAEDQHHAGHLGIGAEDERDGAEEQDAAPATRSSGLGRSAARNLGRSGGRRRHRSRGPGQEREEESHENQEDPEDRQRARGDDHRHDEDQRDTRLVASDGHREGNEPGQEEAGSKKPAEAHGPPFPTCAKSLSSSLAPHGHIDGPLRRERVACREHGLIVGPSEGSVDPHHLSGALHLRPEDRVDTGEALEWEHGRLHRDVVRPRLSHEGQVAERSAEH